MLEIIMQRILTAFILAAITSPLFAAENPQSALENKVRSFVNSHCVRCHGAKVQEGELALHNLSTDLSKTDAANTWAKVFEKLQLGEMPPEDEPQPNAADKKAFMEALQVELAHAGIELDNERLLRPEFGNYVDHEKLFDGSVTALPATTARVWLRKSVSAANPGEFTDYAALKQLDEAATQRDLRQIETGLQQVISAIKEGKRSINGKYRLAEIVRSRNRAEGGIDLSGKTPATREAIQSDVRLAFDALGRPEPSPQQLAYYADFVEGVIAKQDNEAGFRALLMALELDAASLYRSELGEGDVDEHGRRLLSPREIEGAYAYLFHSRSVPRIEPDQLLSREGIDKFAREVVDSEYSMDTYRRFFRQYFNYLPAMEVFKGERHARHHLRKRFMGSVLVNELEGLIYYIVESDRDVFRRLLTTDRIFVPFRGVQNSFSPRYGVTNISWATETHPLDRFEFTFLRKLPLLKDDFPELHRWARDDAEWDWAWRRTGDLTKGDTLADGRKVARFTGGAVETLGHLDYYGIDPTPEAIEQIAGQVVLLPADPKQQDGNEKGEQLARFEPMKSPVPRAGVLTHPAWLVANSTFDHSDVVRRGKWIREKLLGGTIPDVPIGVNAAVPPDEDKTLRERMQVTRDQYCWRCHVKMDPLGLPFELYDDFGRYRGPYKGLPESSMTARDHGIDGLGRPPYGLERRPDGEWVKLDASGEITGSGDPQIDGKVDNAIDLMHRLAESERARQVFVRHAFRFFLGRNETLRDSKTLIEADRAYVESGGSFKALVHSLVTSDSFLYRIDP